MHSDLAELGWTEDQWNRIECAAIEEAQRARVATQLLPVVGPEDPTTVAIPEYSLGTQVNPALNRSSLPPLRLTVDSDPTLYLTTISVNVPVRMREAADPKLEAALVMFRRAGNYIARIEDALVFNGRPGPGLPPIVGVGGIPSVFSVRGEGTVDGIFPLTGPAAGRGLINIGGIPGAGLGNRVVTAIIQAINLLDARGQIGPYSCALSPHLYEAICRPNGNLILPRDRILPFLQSPPVRASAIFQNPPLAAWGVVVAGSANPVDIVVAADLKVRFLQTTEEPRLLFRVSERVAIRIKEPRSIVMLQL